MGLALLMPILMVVGTIAAWKMPKREGRRRDSDAEWRDTSLDDWRKERDAAADAEREARQSAAPSGVHPSSERNVDEKKRHQRIGG